MLSLAVVDRYQLLFGSYQQEKSGTPS